MNNPHKNARTTPLGRAEMIRRIVEEGRPLKIVTAEFGLSERRTREWLRRYRMLGSAGLENRSSRPHTIANKTMGHQIGAIGRLRREYRLTGVEIGEKLDLARSTVAGWLARLGLGRLASLEPKPPVRRYQRQNPGELLHLDIKKLGRCERTGHRITGSRKGRSQGAGLNSPAFSRRLQSSFSAAVRTRRVTAFCSWRVCASGCRTSRCSRTHPASRLRGFCMFAAVPFPA